MSDVKDSSYNNQIPTWLSDEYLGKIFSDFVNKDKNVKEEIEWIIEMVQYTRTLNTLSTVVFTATVTNKKNPGQVFHAFIKILSHSGPNNFGISYQIQERMFEREGKCYENFLNEATKIANKIDGFGLYFPTLYHFSMNPLILVLEDMSKKGFEKVTNEEFSLPHCQLVFEHLAKFHALSFYMHNELNIDLSMFENFTGKEIIGNIPIVSTTYQIFMEVAKNWDGGSEFVEKMKKFQPYYIEAIKKLTEIDPEENKFLVISHGDCHKHNYLFRKNMEECSIIDHQMVSWIGPGYDLIGALNTFCEPKDNFVNREFLLKCYHTEFKRCLKALNFSHKIPTLFDVHMEVLKNGLTDLLFWTVYVPLGSMDNSPENTKSFLERYKDALNTPRQKELSKFFTTFINRGYFDCEEDET